MELLVAVTLGLFIVAVMLGLLARNSEARGELEKSARQVENGRYALQRLSEDLRHAGFYGDFAAPAAPASVPDKDAVCERGLDAAGLASLKVSMGMPVQAFTDVTAGNQPSCIDNADFVSGTSVLVVRFASSAPKLADGWAVADLTDSVLGLTVGSVYVQANTDDMILVRRTAGGLLSSDDTNFTTLLKVPGPLGTQINARLLRVITRIYFISPCSRLAPGETNCTAAADDGAPVPTLKMIEPIGSTTTPTPIAVAEGIERLEFNYGVDNSTAGAAGAGIAQEYKRCNPCSASDWSQVVSMRISLLARNVEKSPGFSDNKSYELGGPSPLPSITVGPLGDSFKRHVFQQVVRLNNLSMRREE